MENYIAVFILFTGLLLLWVFVRLRPGLYGDLTSKGPLFLRLPLYISWGVVFIATLVYIPLGRPKIWGTEILPLAGGLLFLSWWPMMVYALLRGKRREYA